MSSIENSMKMLWDKVKSVSEEYTDIKALVFNDNVTEMVDDTFKSIKLINNIGKCYDIIKLKHFIKGLNCEDINKQDLDILIRYLDNHDNKEFVYSTMKKIVNSNSKICCYIMGLLFNDITNKNRDINQIDIVVINALGNLNDFDIRNFYKLLNIFYKTDYRKSTGDGYISVYKLKEYSKKLDINLDELTLTAEICDKNQIFNRETYADLSIDEDDVGSSELDYDDDYKITVVGKKLYELVRNYYSLQECEL